MIRYIKNAVSFILLAFILTNCEKEITADLPDPEEKIVVDGYIESGQPPIVVLNQNFPYFGTFSLDFYQTNFVKDATVIVSDDENDVTLTEICWSELEDAERELLAQSIGVSVDSLGADFEYCVYTSFTLLGEYGKTYLLDITTADGKHLTAETTIPQPVPLDSMWIEQHAGGEEFEQYWRIYIEMTDPETSGNYYRYFTQTDDEPYYPGPFSVFDDALFNGENIHFPMDKGEPKGSEFDLDTAGYFEQGESVNIKFCTIDKASYDFWNTLEYSANSAGPLGAAVEVLTNINGGIGIWSGYGVMEYSINVEP